MKPALLYESSSEWCIVDHTKDTWDTNWLCGTIKEKKINPLNAA